MRLNVIISILSNVLKHLSWVVLIPVIIALIDKDYGSVAPFVSASLISLFFGFLAGRKPPEPDVLNNIKKTEALFSVFLAWVLFALVCMIPYLFYHMHPVDALFESMSGITTTGSTIMRDFSLYPKALFFFRSMTQWFGGIGIIVVFIAILPQFAVAGRQMFFAESPGPIEEKLTPRIRHTATAVWIVYLLLTLIETVLLKFAGMDWYNALCNTLSTIAGGGFSPNPQSILGYNSGAITWIITVFMFLSGVNFALQYRVLIQRKFKSIWHNEEFKVYLAVVFIISAMLALILYGMQNYNLHDAFKDGFFQVVSIITTTGFASADFNLWSTEAKVILVLVMFLGASAGAASGGIKIIRYIFIFKYLRREISKIIHPQAIVPIKLNGIAVTKDVRRQMISFVMFYFFWIGISTFIVSIVESSATTGLTGTLTTLGNIGPGLGILGPFSHFGDLHIGTKLLFIFNMLVGRLELVPFLAMLHPDFWSIKTS